VAELAGHGVGAVHQLAVDEKPDADAFRHGDGDEVPDVLGVLAEPELGEGAGVGGVLEEDGQADDRFEHGPQVHGRPAQVRREHQVPLRVDAAGEADADAFDARRRKLRPERRDGLREPRREGLRRRRGVPLLLGLELRVEAGQADRREVGPQLDADGADPLGVDVQEARAAAAREEPELAFVDPALDDELVDDGRDRAALQAGSPGQVGPGQGFVPANQAERDSTVDLPRRFAGRDLEAGEVDLAHAHLRHERAGEQRLPDPRVTLSRLDKRCPAPDIASGDVPDP
jgi:hypothetical protein